MSIFRAAIVRPNKVDEYPCDKRNRITIPFYEEYAVRVTNTHHRRLKFDILIDGESVLNGGHFILGVGESTVVERRLNGDLKSGRKLQWLPADHAGVTDKRDAPERGIVEIRAYAEKPYVPPVIINTPHPWWPYNPYKPFEPFMQKRSLVADDGFSSAMLCASTPTTTFDVAVEIEDTAQNEGATGEGSHSGQEFIEVFGFETESTPEIIRFYLFAPDTKVTYTSKTTYTVGQTYCRQCGAKARTKSDRYCWKCGNRL